MWENYFLNLDRFFCSNFLHMSLNCCYFKETKTRFYKQNLKCGFIHGQSDKMPIKGDLLTEKALALHQKIVE